MVVGVIAVISRLNVRIRFFITWPQITRKPHHSLSSATWFVRGEPWFFGSMIGEWSLFFQSACLGLLVRVCPLVLFDLIGSSNSNFPLGLKAACIYDVKLALDVKPGTNEEKLPEGKLAVIIVAPMLFTNVLSTSFIAWKAWCAAHPLGKPIFRFLTDAF